MFASKKKTPGYSYFAEGVILKGRLCFNGIIRLDGRLHGEIVSSGTLVVEETAVIIGDILVENIVLSGTVYGNIRASKHVQLNASAKVFGHIDYGDLSIEGAVHEGSSHKFNSDETAEVEAECREILEDAAAQADRSRDEIRAKVEGSAVRAPSMRKRSSAPALAAPALAGPALVIPALGKEA
ncbi:MAG: polymer-forming cytoskeletal protein [Candidatus Adiutrix sp.]|jgi:cytoskeletal protein CcmA (bactofilin family)|nr:polymer-forming cytoskeletal protein [Candidatus Adiutrix sp.]